MALTFTLMFITPLTFPSFLRILFLAEYKLRCLYIDCKIKPLTEVIHNKLRVVLQTPHPIGAYNMNQPAYDHGIIPDKSLF